MPLAPSKRLAAVLAVTAVAAAGLLIPASGSAVPTCTIYWTGASSDNWSTMANWAFNAAGTTAATRTPVASDYVCMSTTPTARPLIRITAGSSVSVNGINWTTSAGSLAVRSSSALTIGTAVPSTLYALEVSGSSTLTLNGNLGVTNGATLKNAVVNGTKILTLSGTTTSVIGDPTTAATVTFDGAKLSNQGPLTVQGITTGFTLNYLYLYNGAQFTNTGSVTWGDQAQVQDNDTASYIANLATGAMSYAGSSATAEANLITNFSNAGTVTVTSGVFDVWDMPATIPSDKGTYAISANATVATAGGYPRAFGSGGKTTGAGTFLVRGSTTLSMVNGVSFGALDVQGSVSNPAAATITVGDLVWEGQIQGGTTNVTGTASLGGSSAWGTATGATVVLKGTSSMYAGTGVLMYGGSSVKNQGTLALAQGSSFSEQDSGTPSSFVNDTTGTLKWTGASAADQVDVNGATFANKGTLNVVKGIVGLGNASLQTGTTQTGAGTIRSVARVDITSGVSLTNFDVAVGDVYPAGTVTVSNLTVQGSIYGGNVLIPTDGTVQLGGASNYAQLRGTTLTNSGAATFAAAGYMPVLQYAGSTFTNKGSLTFRGNTGFLEQDSGTPSSLVNDTGGTINFAGANATDEFDQNSVVFTNKGTLNVTQGILGLGNATLTASTSQTGSGRLRTVGRVDANTGISLKKLDVATGDLYAAGTLSVSDLLFEGSIYGGTTTIPATGTVQLGGPSGYAALHGGTLVNNGSASFPPAGANYAALLQYAGSTLTNKGTLNLSASGVLEQDYATPSTFVNDTGGTVKFAGASATDEFDQNSVVFTNKGTLNVTQGILGLGNTILTASTSQTGSGRLRTVARVDANDGVSLTKLDIVSDLYAAGALSVSDLLFEGSIYGGTTTIPATGTMQLGGPSGYAALHGGTLVNNGSASFPPVGSSYPALLEYAGSTFTNKGTLNLSASGVLEQDYATPSTFVNDTGGTINFAGASATDELDQNSVVFTNKGTLNVTQGILGLGNTTLTASTSQTGSGALRTVARVDANTGVSLKKLDVATGDLYAAGTLSVSDLVLEGSIYGGTTTIPATGSAQFGGAGGYGALHGATLTNKGAGSMATAASQYGGLLEYGGSTFTNQGTLALWGYGVADQDTGTPSSFTNTSTGTVSYTGANDADSTQQGGIPFLNQGTVTVNKGTLNLAEATFADGSSETGAGRLSTYGTVTVNGTVSMANVTSTQDLYVNNALTVANFTMNGNVHGPGTITTTGAGSSIGSSSGTLALMDGVHVVNKGTALLYDYPVYANWVFYGGSTYKNTGTITGGAGFEIIDGDSNPGNSITNDLGAIFSYTGTGNSADAAFVDAVRTTNLGLITAQKLPAVLLQNLTNLAPGSAKLAGGSYQVSNNGDIDFSEQISENAANLDLGTSGLFSAAGGNALTPLAKNSGTLATAQAFTLGQALTNVGTVNVNKATLNPTSYSQTAGTTNVAATATLKSGGGGGAIAIGGGTLTGLGTARGAVAGAGTVKPGTSGPGSLAANPSWNGTTGTLAIDVNGPAALSPAPTTGSDFGQLAVTSGATVTGGALTINTAAGYLPPLSQQYKIVTAGAVTGQFGTINGAILSDGRRYVPSYSATAITLTVKKPPAITSTNSTTFTTGQPGTFTVTATGYETPTVSETGALPGGVTFVNNGDGTATLSGTPTAGTGGVYTFTITASNGVGTDATQAFTLTVNEPPSVKSANNATFTTGQAGTFTVTTGGFPKPALTETGALPSGVTFVDNGNGTATLAGTPAAATGGTYSLSLKAANGVPSDATQPFTLTVKQPPAITSANSATFRTDQANSLSVTTTGFPKPALAETGALPSGVTFVDNGNGTATLSGTPAEGTGGPWTFSIKAANNVGTDATQSFTLTVNQSPKITSANSALFSTGQSNSFSVTSVGPPTAALNMTGTLPNGVTFTDNGNGSGTLAGNPTNGGTFPLTITANNGVGTAATQSFTLNVKTPAHVTSANAATFTVGQAGTFTVTTTGIPAPSVTQTGALPAGVTFTDNGNGTATLAGTPAAGSGGSYPLTVTASNSSGNEDQAFTLTVKQAPAFTSAATVTLPSNLPRSFLITTSGYPKPGIVLTTGSLPSGYTLTDNGNGTATLGGTTSSVGTFNLKFTATNGTAPAAAQNFKLVIKQSTAPSITSALSQTFALNQPNSFVVKAAGYPTPALSVTGTLPAGVSFADNGDGTGTLSGTPTTATTATLTFKAINGIGTGAQQTFTLRVLPPAAPAITTPATATFTTGQAQVVAVRSNGAPTADLSVSGTLPTGLRFTDNGTGTGSINGTAAPDTGGDYPITIKATNANGTATQDFLLHVIDPPAFTSGTSATFVVGHAGTFDIATAGTPAAALTLDSGTLPTGISFHDDGDGTGSLEGTPASGTAGTYNVVLKAVNGASTGPVAQSVAITVKQAPKITSASSTDFTGGTAKSFTVTTGGSPTAAITEIGALPSGITFMDNGDGTATIAGTAPTSAADSYPITLKAVNGVGSGASQAFTLRVLAAPAFTSPGSKTWHVGHAGTADITTTGYPAANLSIDGALPAGIVFTDDGDSSGSLHGSPAADTGGQYPVTLKADNGVGSPANQSFTVTVNQLPAFTSPNTANFAAGIASTFTVRTKGFPRPSIARNGTLPAGVTYTDNGDGTATISGTPTTTGNYAQTLIATNSMGTVKQGFTISVKNGVAPSFKTTATTQTFAVGTASSFTFASAGFPTPTLTETGALPAGITFVDQGDGTATLSGTPAAGSAGTYPFDVKAANGVGSAATLSFTLTVASSAGGPSYSGATTKSFPTGTLTKFFVNFGGAPTPTLTMTGGTLPPGVTFSDLGTGSGRFQGTPPTGSAGSYTVTITADNGIGAALPVTFTLTVT